MTQIPVPTATITVKPFQSGKNWKELDNFYKLYPNFSKYRRDGSFCVAFCVTKVPAPRVARKKPAPCGAGSFVTHLILL